MENRWMYGHMDGISPHSAGLRPLSGPLLCYPLRLHNNKEARESQTIYCLLATGCQLSLSSGRKKCAEVAKGEKNCAERLLEDQSLSHLFMIVTQFHVSAGKDVGGGRQKRG